MIDNLLAHFGVLYNIKLTELNAKGNISFDVNRNKYQINEFGEIISLNLNDNQLREIPEVLYEFPTLKKIILSENKIKKINGLLGLEELEYLDLSNNQIEEIENIDHLFHLKNLNLSENQIKSIKNLNGLNIDNLDLSSNKIEEIKNLDYLPKLTNINLSGNSITEIRNLESLPNILLLNLSNNSINEIKNLENLLSLYDLDLSENIISKIENLDDQNLVYLNLYSNKISKIENLDNLSDLEDLDLSYNDIEEIENLEPLINLTSLDLSGNEIYEIKNLNSSTSLDDLNLRNNNITKIVNLSCEKLLELDLGNNRLNNFEEISLLLKSNPHLEYLSIDNNPFLIDLDIKLEELENHLYTIENELNKLRDNRKEIILPVKIMLLGNHASGKSTFLDYFLTNKIKNKNDSTHILKIVSKPKISARSNKLPEVIFYDFGGQDYYHGVYQAFLSLDTINLLFWHSNKEIYYEEKEAPENDKNIKEKDYSGNEIINFQKEYWLSQIDYANKQRRKYYKNTTEVNYVIQTYADQFSQEFNISGDFRQLFYVSLSEKYTTKKNKLALEYLKECIKEEVNSRRKTIFKTEAEIRLYKYILKNTKEDWTPISELEDIYGSSEDNLKAELEQLSLKGMVLYYKTVAPDTTRPRSR